MTNATLRLDPITDQLIVSFDDDGHSLMLPFTEGGMQVLRKILWARERPDEVHGTKIGTEPSPTAAMIREFLKSNSIKRLSADRKQAKEDERYLKLFGDDDLDLEIDL